MMELENRPVEQVETPENDIPKETQEAQLETPPMTQEEIAETQDEVIASVESGETALESDREKGNFGEMKVDQDCRERGYERISNGAVTDLKEPGHQGLDGVYYNPDGKPPYLIVDAKFNTAQLHKETADGPQLSWNWTDKRLDADVGKKKADEIRIAYFSGEALCVVARVAKDGDVNAPVTYDAVDENGMVTEKDLFSQER